jgi:hypothetical protein
MVTNETTLNAARASIRHDAQVCRERCFSHSPLCTTNPFTPRYSSIRASLVRLALAQSTDSATCVISEVESVGTFDLGSIFQSYSTQSLVVYVATHLRGLAVWRRGC